MKRAFVFIEHDRRRVKPTSLHAITLARRLGYEYSLLVLGSGVAALAESLREYGAANVVVADDPRLDEPLADRYAAVIALAVRDRGASVVLGTSSSTSKDILPRVAGLLDLPMLTDVTGVQTEEGEAVYQRMICAGTLCAWVQLRGDQCVLTARATAFEAPVSVLSLSPIEQLNLTGTTLPDGMQLLSREESKSSRPDLGEARVVVSGGRPLKDQATFNQLIGGLADALGGAVGATRGAVDAGIAANECQVGQTGRIVAPELYVAVGISGAIQHLSGMMDSRVIVAINRDPEAPIFQTANYGLVGDLHEIVPRWIEAAVPPR